MRPILRSLTLGSIVSLCLLALPSGDASACGGGTFTTFEESSTTFTTGHRVVVSISKTQTVLWDQVQFTGNPSDFAWVLPVKPGSALEVGNDAWIDTLAATTSPRVHSPQINCFSDDEGGGVGCGCGSAGDAAGGDKGLGPGDEGDPAVKVTHAGTVGPYETVTLETSTPGVLGQWLNGHGFITPPDVQPILDNYVALGMDFIAVRLKPDTPVSAMQPLRVRTPGPLMSFPLQMLSAGAKDHVAIQLFVISESRLDVKSFPGAVIDPDKLVWDFGTHTSNYGKLRADALASSMGRTFLTTHAVKRSLLDRNETSPYVLSNGSRAESIVEAYFTEGALSGESAKQCDAGTATSLTGSTLEVVDPCADGPCKDVGPGQLDARDFACDSLDDLAVALQGMHPADVWLTRLEANLPKAALTSDLVLAPSTSGEVPTDLQAPGAAHEPCEAALAPVDPSRPTQGPRPRGLGAALAALAAVASMLARRASRRRHALAA